MLIPKSQRSKIFCFSSSPKISPWQFTLAPADSSAFVNSPIRSPVPTISTRTGRALHASRTREAMASMSMMLLTDPRYPSVSASSSRAALLSGSIRCAEGISTVAGKHSGARDFKRSEKRSHSPMTTSAAPSARSRRFRHMRSGNRFLKRDGTGSVSGHKSLTSNTSVQSPCAFLYFFAKCADELAGTKTYRRSGASFFI